MRAKSKMHEHGTGNFQTSIAYINPPLAAVNTGRLLRAARGPAGGLCAPGPCIAESTIRILICFKLEVLHNVCSILLVCAVSCLVALRQRKGLYRYGIVCFVFLSLLRILGMASKCDNSELLGWLQIWQVLPRSWSLGAIVFPCFSLVLVESSSV